MKRVPSFSKKQQPPKTPSPPSNSPANEETYVIDNGVRKRVRACKEQGSEAELPKRYTLEASRADRKRRGSLPDAAACRDMTLMPREQVSLMSEKRREELRLLREAEERRRAQEIVLRFGDLKVSALLAVT
jgi:hypothetical protein